MSLAELIEDHNTRVFMNMDHFAEIHYWNGEEITIVPDDAESLKRKNNNVNDISWDNNTRTILIHTPVKDFPEDEPEPNTQIVFDKHPMKVLDVHENKGMYDILLTVFDARELI